MEVCFSIYRAIRCVSAFHLDEDGSVAVGYGRERNGQSGRNELCIQGSCMSKTGMCFWERVCIEAGFRLIHDGSNSPGDLQKKLGVNGTNFYLKKYRWYIDGKPVNTFVTFKYDEREAVDIQISYKDKKTGDKGELLKEVLNAEPRRNGGEGGHEVVGQEGR